MLTQQELIDLATDFGLPPDSYFSEWEPLAKWQRAALDLRGGVRDRTILDVGCGAARLGSVIFEELGSGLYIGVDPIDEYIALAHVIAERLGAADRMRLAVSADFAFPAEPASVDVAMAQSVFTHMTDDAMIDCLERLRPVMKPGAPFVFSYIADKRQRARGSLYLRKYPFIRRRPASESLYTEWAARYGLRFEVHTDPPHPTGQKVGSITF